MYRLSRDSDWTKLEDYPTARGTSMHRWALEFLVRNAEFRKAVEGISKLAGAKSDPSSAYRRRWREIAERFGIANPVLSAWGGDATMVFQGSPYHLNSNVCLSGLEGRWFVGPDQGWGAALVFDLRKPIAPQIRAAERMLKGTRRAGVEPLRGAQRDRGANYLAMLRVLDARAAGVRVKMIAKTLFPERANKKQPDSQTDYVKKLFKKAVQLRDGGYQHLPGLAVGREAKRLSVISLIKSNRRVI